MRVESITKKISCTVVKTSLLHSAGDLSVSRPWGEHCQPKPVVPIVEINPPKRIGDMAGKLAEFGPQGRFLDYYA
ncbi:MAG: hypothetical protein ABSF37_01535 [Sedimentisphaerales bacterium]